MNHAYNTKPHAQAVIDKQRVAYHHLMKSNTTRTPVEKASYERHLAACPVSDVDNQKLPMVRLRQPGGGVSVSRWVMLGEISQSPGKTILLDLATGAIELRYSVEDLEIVPPNEV